MRSIRSFSSADFLLPARSLVGQQSSQYLAAANCLAQIWALAAGDPLAADGSGKPGNPHQTYAGNHPSSLVLFEALDPATIGKLIGLYEHKVFVQGVIWDVNPFDQFGVELGKRLAGQLSDAVRMPGEDPEMLAGALRALRGYSGIDA
jgi:glucose-6-phosphate isomerase